MTHHKPLLYPADCNNMDKAAIWSMYELERDKLLSRITALEAEVGKGAPVEASPWVPVNERLPEHPDVSRSMHDNRQYLVLVKSGTDRDKPLMLVAWYYGRDHGWSIANVTHWTELPSPPTPDQP